MRPERLYRVFPWLEGAPGGDLGHPLHLHAPQGSGRVDNPEHYLTLYACDAEVGAVGEAFGNFSLWTPGLLEGSPILPGSRRALVTYDVGAIEVLDLDNPGSLIERDLKPSRVVTRDRAVTQRWALSVFSEKRWNGVRWWSYHFPEWGSFGIWDPGPLEIADIRPLAEETDLVREAASILNRIWDAG